MENLIINYDLMHKIYEAQGKKKLPKNFKTFAVSIYPVGTALTSLIDNASIDTTVVAVALATAISYGSVTIMEHMMHKLYRSIGIMTFSDIAALQLLILSTDLNKQNVKTNVDLLLDSKVYHKEYKFILNKKGIPGIIQRKFFNVPVYDYDGKVTETSLLQEHKMGSRQYVLSLSSPTKTKELKPLYGV